MIEVLVVVAIMLILFAGAVIFSVSAYRQQMITVERDSVAAILGQARSLALANVRQVDHGVSISGAQYVLFDGSAYAGHTSTYDLAYPKTTGFTFGGPSEIIFRRLDGGVSSTGTVSIVNGSSTLNISVNPEGQINW